MKSFICRPVHLPEANDRHYIDAHLCQFNFLQASGRNFPQTVQQIKTEQTFIYTDVFMPVFLATVFFTSEMSTTGRYDQEVRMTTSRVRPWASAGNNGSALDFLPDGKIGWNPYISPNIVLFWAKGSVTFSHKVFYWGPVYFIITFMILMSPLQLEMFYDTACHASSTTRCAGSVVLSGSQNLFWESTASKGQCIKALCQEKYIFS